MKPSDQSQATCYLWIEFKFDYISAFLREKKKRERERERERIRRTERLRGEGRGRKLTTASFHTTKIDQLLKYFWGFAY